MKTTVKIHHLKTDMLRGMLMQLNALATRNHMKHRDVEALALQRYGKEGLTQLTIEQYDELFTVLSTKGVQLETTSNTTHTDSATCDSAHAGQAGSSCSGPGKG